MTKNLRAYIAILFSMSFFAFSYVWFKVANEVYRPLTIVFLRLAISVIILSLFLYLTNRFEKIRKEDRIYFFFIALFEPFLYFIFESHGLTYVSSTVASVLIATIPIFTAIGALIFFREKLTLFNYLGVFISFTGILIFIIAGESNLSFNPKGIMLMFFAVLCATGYSLILRKLANNYNPIYIVNVQNIIGLCLFLPVFLISEGRHIPDMVFEPGAAIAVVELAVFGSCGAFILFGYTVRIIGVTRANLFANIIPVLTAVFAYYSIGEIITIEKFAGIIIMITGLYMAQLHFSYRKKFKEIYKN
ncbi:MAG: DMT family transporter [Bacteroidota bacterium]|nr:DMT family transporter [Bacteroidota bacterium]